MNLPFCTVLYSMLVLYGMRVLIFLSPDRWKPGNRRCTLAIANDLRQAYNTGTYTGT